MPVSVTVPSGAAAGQGVNSIAPSSRHWNVAPAAGSAENLNVAVVESLRSGGPETIVVSGAASESQRYSAGLGSTLSNMSMARKSITWLPPGTSSFGR